MEHVFATWSLVHLFMWLKKLFPEPVPGAFTFDIFIADAAASSVRNQGDIYFMFCFFHWARGGQTKDQLAFKEFESEACCYLNGRVFAAVFLESLVLRNLDLSLGICSCSPGMKQT
jgi:hypothetical protein